MREWLNIQKKNLVWLSQNKGRILEQSQTVETFEHDIVQGDATNREWQQPIDLVACETYLGPPMSMPPAEIKLKQLNKNAKG